MTTHPVGVSKRLMHTWAGCCTRDVVKNDRAHSAHQVHAAILLCHCRCVPIAVLFQRPMPQRARGTSFGGTAAGTAAAQQKNTMQVGAIA